MSKLFSIINNFTILTNSCYIEVTLYLLYIAKQNVSKLWQRISHFNVEVAYLIEIVIPWQIATKTISVLLEYVPMQMDSHVYISVMVTTPTIKYYGVVLATLLIIPETINKTVGHRNSNDIFLLIKHSSLWGSSSLIQGKVRGGVSCSTFLTFKGWMLDISSAACTPQWPNVRYIQCLPCKHVVSQPSRCLLEQETQTNQLWVPQQGLVFVRSHDVIYGGLDFNIIYVQTWLLRISWGSDRHDTVGHCLRLKGRTSMMKSSS